MKKVLRKSEALRKGYIKGPKEAQHVINEQLNSNIEENESEDGSESDDCWFKYSAKLAKNEIDKLVAAYKCGNFYNGGIRSCSGIT